MRTESISIPRLALVLVACAGCLLVPAADAGVTGNDYDTTFVRQSDQGVSTGCSRFRSDGRNCPGARFRKAKERQRRALKPMSTRLYRPAGGQK